MDLKDTQALNAQTLSKILSVSEMAKQSEDLKKQGKSIVLAHGTFDLLHLGHVRHLEAARELGDALFVTLTADMHVNKGPGRPLFSEFLRAEMLAALHVIDCVGIAESPDAIQVIDAIRPSVYAKGQDYQNPDGDVTGKIVLEREAVERHGGQVHFTNELEFSSSELINRHFNVFEPHVRKHLSSLRDDGCMDKIMVALGKISDYKIVFVGDAIIDEYQYVLPMGKPPKEHIIATRHQDYETFAGGVFAAANNVASFCREVEIITCLGDNPSYADLIKRSLKPNVRLHNIVRPSSPTTLKQRFVDPNSIRKLFEVYHMNDEPLNSELEQEIIGFIDELCPDADVVITTDFGHGLIGPNVVKKLTDVAKFLAVNTQSNSANLGYNLVTRYPQADFICIDAHEARLALSDRISPVGTVINQLSERISDCSRIIVTNGRHGCITFDRNSGAAHTIPAVARKVVDTVGAGDAFLAVTSPLVSTGLSMDLVGFVGNVVGAMKIEIVGHRSWIEKSQLIKSITGLLK